MLDTRTLKTEPGVYAIRFLLDKRTYIGWSAEKAVLTPKRKGGL